MMSLANRLERFRTGLGVPAVIGGVLDADGSLEQHVVGTVHRATDEPARLDDQWHIGSCTKMMTAAVYAQLVDAGHAHWDQPVASLFPDLAGRLDPGWAGCSVADVFHGLGGMMANLSPLQMLAAWKDQRSLTDQRTAVVEVALGRPPKGAGRFRYSNLGYVVMGAAIDRLAGKPFELALEQGFLQPLGIRSLGYGAPPRVQGHAARIRLGALALFRGSPTPPAHARSDNPPVLSSAGTVHLTLEDWSRFIRLFLNPDAGLLDPATVATLLRLPDTKTPAMAMGWASMAELPGVGLGAQGSNTLWSATVLLTPARDRASLVVCNDGRFSVLGQSAGLAADLLTESVGRQHAIGHGPVS